MYSVNWVVMQRTMALTSQISRPSLLQLRVLRLGSDEDGNVRVGVFPQREEILIGRFVCVALHGIGSADLEMREWAVERVKHNSAMVKDFLRFGGGFASSMSG